MGPQSYPTMSRYRHLVWWVRQYSQHCYPMGQRSRRPLASYLMKLTAEARCPLLLVLGTPKGQVQHWVLKTATGKDPRVRQQLLAMKKPKDRAS